MKQIATVQLQALSHGPEARHLSQESGTVLAVVSRAVYLQTGSGRIVALVDARYPGGPLTVRVRRLQGALARLHNRAGSRFHGDGQGLTLDGGVSLTLAGASEWAPVLPVRDANRSALKEALRALCATISRRDVPGGLGPVALFSLDLLKPGAAERTPYSRDPLLSKALPLVAALAGAWAQRDWERVTRAAVGLLGLGPGLTPSGDDLLAGLLAVCSWLGSGDGPQAAMAEAVLREAPRRTTRLSARLLTYAAEGLLYEPALCLGSALLTGRAAAVEPAAHTLFDIGHTSGADMAAGIALSAVLCDAGNPPAIRQ